MNGDRSFFRSLEKLEHAIPRALKHFETLERFLAFQGGRTRKVDGPVTAPLAFQGCFKLHHYSDW
jgi:hypothetical protein